MPVGVLSLVVHSNLHLGRALAVPDQSLVALSTVGGGGVAAKPEDDGGQHGGLEGKESIQSVQLCYTQPRVKRTFFFPGLFAFGKEKLKGIHNTGSVFQHFRENSFGGKLVKSQNLAQFWAKTPKILFKTQFSGKNMEF